MVGKDTEPKNSRIFQQCYVKCCKLQNLTPLNNLLPAGNGKALDFCVDRIKYADWPPILNALCCDLSLHSVAIRCRQQVKTVLEHIDCERLAKTVNKRAVILTNFMLSNVMEAIAQLLSNTTLLNCLLLEGLPLKIPYLNPLSEALTTNSSIQHLHLPRCLLGDAGCLAICKALKSLPNVLTLDLSGCDLSLLGASYIADLVKYQKIHRYSENWVHTLRYRLPDLDTMAGLRRITLCGNTGLGDAGVGKLFEVLADDLWIKALDVQNCGVTEVTATAAMQMLHYNTTLVVLDLRFNTEVSNESVSKVRAVLRDSERKGQFVWLSAGGYNDKLKTGSNKMGAIIRDRVSSTTRSSAPKYPNKTTTTVKKEKDFVEELSEQLQEEISHRRQLEELNLQLVAQMKEIKQQQIRLWANQAQSSGSEQSFQGSERSTGVSSSTGSSSSVPIDQNTLAYIQQAFKDIYAFIKNNQCHGQCHQEPKDTPERASTIAEVSENSEAAELPDMRVTIMAKKAQSAHCKVMDNVKVSKTTKSAHLLGDKRKFRESVEMTPEMIERQMGDTVNTFEEKSFFEEMMAAQSKGIKSNVYDKLSPNKVSPCSSVVSDSSSTLVCSPRAEAPAETAINPREALYSSSDDESS